MLLDEAKQILNKNGFLIENNYIENKYIFKEADEEWFGEFLKRYDAYGFVDGRGAPSEVLKVYDYSDGKLTFIDKRGNVEDDIIDFSTFLNFEILYADADDVKEFMSSYKSKQNKHSRKKGKNWTAAEIAKLIRDSGISIDAIIDALKNGED